MIYWLLNIALLALVVYLSRRYLQSNFPSWVFPTALFLRIIAGIATGIIFHHYYPGSDSIRFFEGAELLLDQASLSSIILQPLEIQAFENQPRVLFFLKILSVFMYMTGQSYWLTVLWFAIISFLVSWWATLEWTRIFPHLKLPITVTLLFIPSILFWSSGILKDTVSYCALLLLVTSALKFRNTSRIKWFELLIAGVSLYLLYAIKHYLLITFLLFAGILFGSLVFKRLNGVARWLTSLGILLLFFISTQFIHPYLTIDRIPQTISENNQAIIQRTPEENQLGIVVAEPSWTEVIEQVPVSLYTGLFRPTIFDNIPWIGIIHQIENLLLLTLAILSLLIAIKQRTQFDWPLLIPGLFAICLLATLLAMTTPNLGTLVRYKNAFMPFLFIILSVLPFQYLTSKSEG